MVDENRKIKRLGNKTDQPRTGENDWTNIDTIKRKNIDPVGNSIFDETQVHITDDQVSCLKKDSVLSKEDEVFRLNVENVMKSRYLREKYGALLLDEKGKPFPREASIRNLSSIVEKAFKEARFSPNTTPTRRVAINAGLGGIISLGDNLGIKYNEIIEAIGKTCNRDDSRWIFFSETSEGRKLSKDESKRMAGNYFKDQIIPKCNENSIPIPPPKKALVKMGFSGFISNCTKFGYTYTNLVKDMGLKPNKEADIWQSFFQDENGKPLSHSEKVKKWGEHYEKLFPSLGKNETISSTMIRKIGEDRSLQTMRRSGVKLNEVNRVLNREIKLDKEKWRVLDFDEKGNSLSHQETCQHAANILINKIIPAMQELHGLGEHEVPSVDQLRKAQFNDFVNAITARGLTYNEILREANLITNRDVNKWEILEKDEKGNKLNIQQSIDKAAEIYKNQIIPKLIAANKYEQGKTPSKEEVINAGCGDFINAATYRGIPYNEIVTRAGFTPNEASDNAKIGQDMHSICERLMLEHANDKKWIAVKEKYISSDKASRCDISIVVDSNLRSSMKNAQEIDKKISMIHVDFYLGNSAKSRDGHCSRNYQNENNMLILVPTTQSGKGEVPSTVPHHENVRIFGPDAFAQFLGLRGDIKNKILETMKIANDATWKGEEYKEILKENATIDSSVPKEILENNAKKFKELVEKMEETRLVEAQNKGRLDYWLTKDLVNQAKAGNKEQGVEPGKEPSSVQGRLKDAREPQHESGIEDALLNSKAHINPQDSALHDTIEMEQNTLPVHLQDAVLKVREVDVEVKTAEEKHELKIPRETKDIDKKELNTNDQDDKGYGIDSHERV